MNVINLRTLKKLFLYGIFGCFSASMDTFLYVFLEGVLHYPNLIANFFSVNFGILISFLLNTFFNFKTKDKIRKRALNFFCIGYSGLILSSFIMWMGVDFFDFKQIYVKLFSVLVVACFQFILNSVITYKK